ncbi:MFS transporter [Pseudomonas aeruginosa]
MIQGASGAVLIPLSMQLILTESPSSRIPLGMALFSLSNSVAQAAGPSIGGWLADAYSWRAGSFSCNCCRGIALLAAVAWSIAPATATANACAPGRHGSASARWSPASARCRSCWRKVAAATGSSPA